MRKDHANTICQSVNLFSYLTKSYCVQWRVDSAGVSDYMLGSPPDQRGIDCMKKRNVFHYVQSHRARQIHPRDFDRFDFIFALDEGVFK